MTDIRNPHPLIAYLHRARSETEGDRALLAVLRRSLGQPPGDDLRAVARLEGFIVRLQGDEVIESERQRRIAYLVAGLFALCRNDPPDSGRGLGASLADLVKQRGAVTLESVERRLAQIVDADEYQLPARLRAVVQLLDADGRAPDFSVLLRDLVNWNNPKRTVQRRWLRDFHLVLNAARDDAA